jgi:N-acetyl-1-D-myo-inositol-2-amino-2-deoxy-alpha-D-glucopyranoside deacetylase
VPGLLAFHAHPDDESLSMGGTLARYADAGEQVVVVTATRGEVGEIHNHDDPESLRPRLAEVREAELHAACSLLGVSKVEILGYRDSGMMGTADNDHPAAFWRADFMEAVARLVRVIRRYRPEVMTAYDPYGGYGHPDHIQVHRVGTAAFYGAADVGRFPPEEGEEPWQPAKLYWATWPRERTRRMRQMMAVTGAISQEEAGREPDSGTMDQHITTYLDVASWFDRKWAAVVAHRTQIGDGSWFLALPEEVRREGFSREAFILVSSRAAAPAEAPDLFAGLR